MNAPEITRTIAKEGATDAVKAAFAALPEVERGGNGKGDCAGLPGGGKRDEYHDRAYC